MFDLTDRVALVTGGNGGIGLAMAKGLADANARVILTGRDASKGSAAAKIIGKNAIFLTADVTDPDAIQNLVRQAEAIDGRLDILVNNAGTSIRRAPQALSLADWHTVLDTKPDKHFSFLPSRASSDETRRWWQNHQHRFHAFHLRNLVWRGLRR